MVKGVSVIPFESDVTIEYEFTLEILAALVEPSGLIVPCKIKDSLLG